jgi:ubiquinone/menaquinone biosynthesis C-methylase UbiE
VPDGVFCLGELESLPFANGAFDLVTGFNSFQYAANPGAALAEAKWVVKPGAHVVVVTWGDPVGKGFGSIPMPGYARVRMPGGDSWREGGWLVAGVSC